MKKYVAVPGTWGYAGEIDSAQWWVDGSEFSVFMRQIGYEPVDPDNPFIWTTDVNGTKWFVFSDRSHHDWKAGAAALKYYLANVPYEDRNIIAHSHGGQVALYTASFGVEIRTLITIATPVRHDMRKVIAMARPNIGYWTHVYSDWSDIIQILGGIFDGSIGIRRKMKLADINLQLPKVGHSAILRDPKRFAVWVALAKQLETDNGR